MSLTMLLRITECWSSSFNTAKASARNRQLPSPITGCIFLPCALRNSEIEYLGEQGFIGLGWLFSPKSALLDGSRHFFVSKLCLSKQDFFGVGRLHSCWHFFFSQHCLRLPGPPNFGLSLQNTQVPQSERWHTEQDPHLLLFVPSVNYVSL